MSDFEELGLKVGDIIKVSAKGQYVLMSGGDLSRIDEPVDDLFRITSVGQTSCSIERVGKSK